MEIDAPELSEADAAACRDFVDTLPDRVGDQERVESEGAFGAAYGDPPIVVTCGVGKPDHLMTNCTSIDGVDWYFEESDEALIATTVGRQPAIEIVVPAEYDQTAPAQVDLGPAITAHTTAGQGCTG